LLHGRPSALRASKHARDEIHQCKFAQDLSDRQCREPTRGGVIRAPKLRFESCWSQILQVADRLNADVLQSCFGDLSRAGECVQREAVRLLTRLGPL
jgi:hypothetical protein